MTNHRTSRAGPLRAFAALTATLAIVAVSLVAAAPPASASYEMKCNGDGDTFNACLHFEWLGYGWMEPHVGIDVYMPEQYGREIVAYGANFKASLWGDDGGGSDDDFIAPLWVAPGWPIADSTGIATEFVGRGLDDELDEDDGVDELYARVSYRDPHTGLTREFRTGVIRGEYG